MDATNKQINSHLSANTSLSKKQIIIGNFLGGLAWGLGSVVGATIIVAIIILILKWLGIFQSVQDIVSQNKIIFK